MKNSPLAALLFTATLIGFLLIVAEYLTLAWYPELIHVLPLSKATWDAVDEVLPFLRLGMVGGYALIRPTVRMPGCRGMEQWPCSWW